MKILRLIMICLLILGFSGRRTESSQQSERQNKQENQSQTDPNECTDKIVDELLQNTGLDDTAFRMKLMELAARYFVSDSEDDPNMLKCKLDKIRSVVKSPRKNMLLLFLQAETNYKLNEFEEAQKQYLQLKLSLDNSEDPLFSKIEKRLKISDRKAFIKKKKEKFEEGINRIKEKPYLLLFKENKEKLEEGINKIKEKPHLSPLLILSILLLIFLLIFLPIFLTIFILRLRKYLLKRKSSRLVKNIEDIYSGERSEDSPSTIIPTKDLITIDDLCKQDGRVSLSAVRKYEADRENWIPDKEDQTSQYARLIFEGHEMIKRVNRFAPYPLVVVSSIPLIKKLPDFWRDTVTGFLFISLWIICLSIAGQGISGSNYVTQFLIAALVISCLTGLRKMAVTTINSIDEMICMMEVVEDHKSGEKIPQSIRKMELWIRDLFRSPWQFYIVYIIYIIILIKVAIALIANNLGIHYNIELIIGLMFIIPILFVVCPIIWFILASLMTLNKICKMKDLAINPLSPIKTMGLEKWISLMGTCNITASIILTFGCFIPIINRFIELKDLAGGWFWFYLIMPMLFIYWVYPYVKLGGLVKDMKRKRMQFMKTRIAQIFNAWIRFEENQLKEIEKCRAANVQCDIENIFSYRTEMMEKLKPHLNSMENYYEVFKKIDESPQSYIDFYSALELGKAMGIPSLLAVISALLF